MSTTDAANITEPELRLVLEAANSAVYEKGSLAGLALAGRDLSGLDLSGVDLSGADLRSADISNTRLRGANLSGALLSDANLTGCDLSMANLAGANLEHARVRSAGLGHAALTRAAAFGADFSGSTLTGADLRGTDFGTAKFVGARLRQTDLREAGFVGADLSMADVSHAEVSGANFDGARFSGAALAGVSNYQDASFLGSVINEADFTGAYLFRRSVMDQNYLHEFRTRSRGHAAVYWVWWLTSDCGRSLVRWAVLTALIAFAFAGLYLVVDVDYGDRGTSLAPLYFSVVTLTTLGYGDIVPASSAAQFVAICEALIGYVLLGGLLSILANKLARRAE